MNTCVTSSILSWKLWKLLRFTCCRFQVVASTLLLASYCFHFVVLNLKGHCVLGLPLRALLVFEGVLTQFFIFIFCLVPPFHVVASMLSLPCCHFEVATPKWLPQVVASTLLLPCLCFQVVTFTTTHQM